MALPGRTGRRGGAGFRWIAAGVVITLLVLLIDASLHSRSTGPQQALATETWVDRVLPVIASSNGEGQVLQSVWTNGLKLPASSVAAMVDQVAAGAGRDYRTVSDLRPPAALGGPSGLLEAALLARSKAAGGLDRAFRATLGAAAVPPGVKATSTTASAAVDPATVVPEVAAAGAEIQVSDQAYQLFQSSVPSSVGVKLPASAWGAHPGPYGPQAAQTFLAALQNAAVTTPVYQVKIYGIATTPPPVSVTGGVQAGGVQAGGVQMLPSARSITLDVVLADTGNQPSGNLTVTAAISPAGAGPSSVRDYVSLAVGQAYTITGLGPLDPPQGVPVTLTVTVSSPASSSGAAMAPVTSTLVFQTPGATPPSTTSTTSVSSSTSSSSSTSTTHP